MAEPLLRVERVTKRFEANGPAALDDVSLTIERGELFVLLGGSGSGKTTLLRLLAGFERADSGRILLDGEDIIDTPPYERPVNMMFQSYALFPHMTVAANVAFGLRQDGLPRAEIDRRVAEGLAQVQMADYARRRPDQLSGGQRQRVALARSLVKRPKLLLLDEPLAALDKKLREETQFELINLQEQTGITFIIVTHDQKEAMTMASRMAVMQQGRIQQIGTPVEIYETPASRQVAAFIGSVNIFEARLGASAADQAVLDCAQTGQLQLDRALPGPPGQSFWIAVRPEKMRISRMAPDQPANKVAGVIAEIAYLGEVSTYHVRLPDGSILRATVANQGQRGDAPLTWGDAVWLAWAPEAGVALSQ